MSRWGPDELVQMVNRGLMSIDEGRVELGFKPWGLPETSDPLVQDEGWRERVRRLVEVYEGMLLVCGVRHDPSGRYADEVAELKRGLGLWA